MTKEELNKIIKIGNKEEIRKATMEYLNGVNFYKKSVVSQSPIPWQDVPKYFGT